jgi:hypothetical protein
VCENEREIRGRPKQKEKEIIDEMIRITNMLYHLRLG